MRRAGARFTLRYALAEPAALLDAFAEGLLVEPPMTDRRGLMGLEALGEE